MRKLATIQKIEEVFPIEGADRVQKARIQGWWCVVGKDDFISGDKCLYFEVDSLLPNIPQFEFLLKGSSLKTIIIDGKEIKGHRLKTKRFLGQISQGLALPLNKFPEILDLDIGTDVSEQLNVFKYELPIPAHLSGEIKGSFPGFIPKTDEERIQNCLDLLEQYKGQRFYVTSKLDGSSCTIYKYNGEFGVCSRNLELKETEKNTLWKIVNKYDLKYKIQEGYAIQGEIVGEGIQDNRLKLKGQDIYVFYVINLHSQEYLNLYRMKEFTDLLGLKTVPVVEDSFRLNHSCEDLLKMADGPSPLNSNVPQEGIVFRLYESTQKITFKTISNEYLLKYGL